MRDVCFLGVDFGTSYINGRVIDEEGNLLLDESTKAPGIISPKPRWTEVSPFEYLFMFKRFLRKIIVKADCKKIYVGLSSVAPIFIPVDRDCYPLINGILYNDTRSEAEIEELKRDYGDIVFRINGNPVNNQQWLPKILWFKKNMPELYKRVWKFVELTGFITCKLTGEIAMEKCTAQEEGLLDYRKRIVSQKILEELKIEPNYLPKLMGLEEEIGKHEMNGVKLIFNPGTVDFIASSISLGILKERLSSVILGPTGVVSFSVKEPKPDKRLFLDLGPFEDLYYVNGATSAAGIFFEHILELFKMKKMLKKVDKLLLNETINTEGLVMLPYILGERSPILDLKAKGVIFGITNFTKKPQLIKASLEAVAFSIRHIFDTIKEVGYESDFTYLSGYISKLNYAQKLMASVLKTKIITIEDFSPADGDAYISMKVSKTKNWQDIADIKKRQMSGEIVYQEQKSYFEKNYVIYRELYNSLYKLFRI
ncbi:MAG: FGGY family carbohydrate kinase [Nitrososphaeria archaeon]